jgi:integrase/recombinase XerD
MLLKYFETPARIRAIRSGPAGEDGFVRQLSECGYGEVSARRHIRAAEHLAQWATRQGLSVHTLDEEALRRFGSHLDRCRCGRYCCADRNAVLTGARHFIRYLRGIEEPSMRERQPIAAEPELLKSFCTWMRARRGTSDQALYNYSKPIRKLISRIGEEPSRLDAHCLRQFVLKQSQGGRWAARLCRTALRMFLRFLIVEGHCRSSLLGAIPVVPHWRLSSLPRYLPSEDVERLIASCDRSSPVGKRDRAVLLLLARLGLRAGDIVQMRLRDIDWKDA